MIFKNIFSIFILIFLLTNVIFCNEKSNYFCFINYSKYTNIDQNILFVKSDFPNSKKNIKNKCIVIGSYNFYLKDLIKFSIIISIVLLLVVIFVLVWSFSLKKQIKIKTKQLEKEFLERQRIKGMLKESEKQYYKMFKKSPDPMAITLKERGIYIDINESFEKLFEYNINELLGKTSVEIGIFSNDNQRNLFLEKLKEKGEVSNYETVLYTKSKKEINVSMSSVILNYRDIDCLFTIIHNISERKYFEEILKKNDEKIKASLEEKEILLKEIHHRVKNNLQIISSLLNLQQSYLKKTKDIEVFQDSQNRVKSMAMIHEKLYEKNNLSNVDFRDYINSLVHFLYSSYGITNNQIELDFNIDNLYFDIDKSIPLGLLLNELVSNCFKHAFPNNKNGKISIFMSKIDTNQIRLIVKDNGIGFKQGFDIENVQSLGIQLIKNICLQLNGKLEINNNNGIEVKIDFDF